MLIKRSEETATGDHSLSYYFSYYRKIICHIISSRVELCLIATEWLTRFLTQGRCSVNTCVPEPRIHIISGLYARRHPYLMGFLWRTKRQARARVSEAEAWDSPRNTQTAPPQPQPTSPSPLPIPAASVFLYLSQWLHLKGFAPVCFL